jgi:hypothetical protein
VTARPAAGSTALIGLLAAIALIAHPGFGPISGPALPDPLGVLWIALLHLIALALLAHAWRSLLVIRWPGSIGTFLRARWVRDG